MTDRLEKEAVVGSFLARRQATAAFREMEPADALVYMAASALGSESESTEQFVTAMRLFVNIAKQRIALGGESSIKLDYRLSVILEDGEGRATVSTATGVTRPRSLVIKNDTRLSQVVRIDLDQLAKSESTYLQSHVDVQDVALHPLSQGRSVGALSMQKRQR